MGCAGFTCSKHSLCALNILYVMVSLLMIAMAAWGKWLGLVSSFQVVGGVTGVGVFLFFVALAGLLGAVKHHQDRLLEVGWNNSRGAQRDVEKSLNCCGFRHVDLNAACPAACFPKRSCLPCADKIQAHADEVLRLVGGTGLFFSLTEIVGVWLTYRFRNQKDPRANPSAFL